MKRKAIVKQGEKAIDDTTKVLLDSLNMLETKALTEIQKHDIGSEKWLKCWSEIRDCQEKRRDALGIVKPERKIKFDKEWIPVIGSLAGLLLVLNYEQASVITGKAFSMVSKVR